MRKNTITISAFCIIGTAAIYMLNINFSNPTTTKKNQMKIITVKSADFVSGERIPDKHTWKHENVSPHLTWSKVPIETKSITVICDDPDAPGKTWVHWIMFNLPTDTQELAPGITKDKKLANGALQGTNDFNQVGFDGPWPPSGHGDHHYHFKIYALDTMINLAAGATKQQLEKAMHNHIIAQGKLVGVYSR